MPRKPPPEPPPLTPSEVMLREAKAVYDGWLHVWRASWSIKTFYQILLQHRENIYRRYVLFILPYGFLIEEFAGAIDRECDLCQDFLRDVGSGALN